MAESLSWLKLVPRSRTPTVPRAPNSSEREPARDSHPSEHRRPGSSCMSSYLDLASQIEPEPEPLVTDTHAACRLIRGQDQVWYNPSLKQMVEALQVILMTRGVLQHIPLEYNTYVLHLVEGFANAREKIRSVDRAYQEVKQSLEQNLEQFRLVADDWLERESQYRAEVKRLEVLLSTRDGLEAVTLARTNSVVDRSGYEVEGFVSRLDRFRKHQINSSYTEALPSPPPPWAINQTSSTEPQVSNAKDSVPLPKILDTNNDFLLSEKIRQQDAATSISTTNGRRRQAYRRGEVPQHDMKGFCTTAKPAAAEVTHRDHDSSYHSSAVASTGLITAGDNSHADLGTQVPTEKHPRHVVSQSLLGSEAFYHQELASDLPASQTRNVVQHVKNSGLVNDAAVFGSASRHHRDFSGFSFEPGDDLDSSLGEPPEGRRVAGPQSYEQFSELSAYEGTESLAMKIRRRHPNNNTGSPISSISNKEWSLSGENSSPHTYDPHSNTYLGFQSSHGRPIWAYHDLANSRHTMIGIAPNQRNYGLSSSLADSMAGHKTAPRQQAEMGVRMAATRAVAKGVNDTKQK
ncbi:hypothetical protein F5Y19DRAFT_165898 [Xylariaceae sp. FL1651]|nr:hypothetical protein F5Y19DRAFT_165898 [Xylariaceae sp. FL1651]